ncbi:MAG TPA: mannose-6-phosphate isomerase, class I [Pseudonocardiaceae bacterium]
MDLLRNPVRPYAWGSRTAIAQLLGRPVPAPHPEAELWIGAHPTDPSMLVGDEERSLYDAVKEDPLGQIGEPCTDQFGPRLPFLLKVLAAEEPLSMQAHPSAEQARSGFAREQASGLPVDHPQRNYKDPDHKPELLCALTEFHALAGFRAVDATLELLHTLDVRQLAAYVELLNAQPDADGLRALFTTWITLPQTALAQLVPYLLNACVEHLRAHGPFSRECRTVLQLAELYPTDAGVLTSLLLNHLVLAPGEAIYLPAGNLHAYLHGTGVEIMANSDNVLRGGLTPKHVDVPELLRVLDFRSGDMPVLRGEPGAGREIEYRTPMPEFRLSRLDWAEGDTEPAPLAQGAPQILLCVDGTAVVETADGALELPRGASAWLPAGDPPATVRGHGDRCRVFLATTGKVC